MRAHPEVLLNHSGRGKKISVILIDWGVRESFHSLEYLNKQTASRDDYELIWLEFYNRKPDDLRWLAASGRGRRPALDKWFVLGYPDDVLFHKHRLYNVGILAAEGEVCVFCDSDAIFRPTFIENLLRAFEQTPNAAIHVDEVRNINERFHPFRYPTVEDILGPGCINWDGATTTGLATKHDRLHRANYGACLAARRRDLLTVGGADEHIDYLGYVCGPYDLTFRLRNYGRQERWLSNEYLYHVWHPNQSGFNSDYQGPHDGRCMSSRALHARASGQIQPYQRNLWVGNFLDQRLDPLGSLLRSITEKPEPSWLAGAQPTSPPDFVYWVDKNYYGYNLFIHLGEWFALPKGCGAFDPAKARRGGYRKLLRATDEETLRSQIIDARSWKTVNRMVGQLGWLVGRVRAQPLHRLPVRVWRKARRRLLENSHPCSTTSIS
jgi:hypothetical protein